jgi:hypothetical protein
MPGRVLLVPDKFSGKRRGTLRGEIKVLIQREPQFLAECLEAGFA